MPGLPIAGQGGGIGDPYKYGKFQNFLPDIGEDGVMPSATGLRASMFNYKSPGGVTDDSGSGSTQGGDTSKQLSELRDMLAKLTSGGGGTAVSNGDPGFNGPGGGFGGGGTMGMGGGGPMGNGFAPPAGALPIQTPPGGFFTPQPYQMGPGSPLTRAATNSDPAAAAAAAAAAKMSGGGMNPLPNGVMNSLPNGAAPPAGIPEYGLLGSRTGGQPLSTTGDQSTDPRFAQFVQNSSADKIYPAGWQGAPGATPWGPGINAQKGDPNVPAAIPDSAWALMGMQKPGG